MNSILMVDLKMNEKIKQLKEQARDFYLLQEDLDCSIRELHELVDEKFAELIVKECVEQLELVRKYRYDRVQPLENQQTIIDECQYQIKEHFGVKE